LTGYKGQTHRALPLLCQVVAHVCQRCVKLGLGRETWAVKLVVPVNLGYLFADLVVSETVEEVKERLLELERVERLARPLGEVVRNELVKALTADKALKIVEEMESLLIGHRAVDIFRIHIIMLDD
jgi:hypothetical protein